jgi:hypothetical protein
MARRLDSFPEPTRRGRDKYPWGDWTDGSVWEIRRGDDYEVATENMRVNLHMKADALGRKVRTRKVSDAGGERLVFQFQQSEETEVIRMLATEDPDGTKAAMYQLYLDAIDIYERARNEVTIERSDGRRQKYAATRYKQQIEKGYEENTLVPTVARIIRKRTLGYGHLEEAGRPDLMLETLVLDAEKPYHPFFSPASVRIARERMDEYYKRDSSEGEATLATRH